jgi:ribosomal protein L7Ae-like RNA K-turn-binding protein
MNPPNKVLNLLGIARRAGKLISGEEMVIKAVQKREAHLVILSVDASDNTRKKITDKCRSYQIPYLICFEREALGKAIGKTERVVIAIIEKGLAGLIKQNMEESAGGGFIE